MSTATVSRDDRQVCNCRLRVGPSAPVQKLTFTIQEALRLCSLPGESEGRVYYFRSVHLTGLPENGDRRVWLDGFQSALLALARNAVHGESAGARTSAGVFFETEQRACESLLTRILRRQPTGAWFWSAVSNSPPGVGAAAHVTGIIERLSRSDASWFRVAAMVLALPDPVLLLESISGAAARRWLCELHGDSAQTAFATPAVLCAPTLQVIERAVNMFGWDDLRVVWLVSLAVILASPNDIENGVAVRRARAILQPYSTRPALSERRVQAEHGTVVGTQENQSKLDDSAGVEKSASHSERVFSDESQALSKQKSVRRTTADRCFGKRTAGAGLYFLLNALPHLRIGNSDLGPRFLAHFFQDVACHSGIQQDDPILSWTVFILEQGDQEVIDERLRRVLFRKVRRWCWRNGKIGLRAIVRRPGLVTLTRTDLDISLSLDSADVRIRRIGLDLDPGWIPCFGRVIRFHYLGRGELNG